VPSPPQAAADELLTPREGEVLRWLSIGKTDRDIGDILGISHRTVHKHLQRIYEKLGVETRTAAAARWMGRHASGEAPANGAETRGTPVERKL
jgi:DNA-binding CsgD family transcriptional regulator